MSNKDRIAAFMQEHGVSKDEIWQVPGGKSYAVYHHVLERIAYQNSIKFDPPTIIEANSAEGVVSLMVVGHFDKFSEWSIGEASPKNNKNSYCWAMAEKRAKDRVILKLLNIHGVVYSDAELDDREPQKPTGKPALSVVEKEERSAIESKAFEQLSKMLESTPSIAALGALMKSPEWTTTIDLVHADDRPRLRKIYAERNETLSYKEAQ